MDEEVKHECVKCFQEEAILEKTWAKDKEGEEILIIFFECKSCGHEWHE